MKRGGMYQRDARATVGCLIVAIAVMVVSFVSFVAKLAEILF